MGVHLVSEAEDYAKDLIETARSQQRDALQQAHDSLETAVKQIPAAEAAVDGVDQRAVGVVAVQ